MKLNDFPTGSGKYRELTLVALSTGMNSSKTLKSNIASSSATF